MPAQKTSVATTKPTTAKPAKKEQAVKIQVDRAYAKPDWDVERNVAERALWQVVALALPDGHPNSPTCAHLKFPHPERGVTKG